MNIFIKTHSETRTDSDSMPLSGPCAASKVRPADGPWHSMRCFGGRALLEGGAGTRPLSVSVAVARLLFAAAAAGSMGRVFEAAAGGPTGPVANRNLLSPIKKAPAA